MSTPFGPDPGDDLGLTALDAELSRRLGAAAPAVGDVGATLDALGPRLRRARLRRRSGALALGALGIVAFVGSGAALVGRDGGPGGRIVVPPAGRDGRPAVTVPTVVGTDPGPDSPTETPQRTEVPPTGDDTTPTVPSVPTTSRPTTTTTRLPTTTTTEPDDDADDTDDDSGSSPTDD